MTIGIGKQDHENARWIDGGDAACGFCPSDPKLFIIAKRCGRLANRLMLFAHFIALAEEQGHRLINFTFHSYAHLFEVTRHDVYCRYPAGGRRSRFDAVPGINAAIRKTRILYHATRAAALLIERFPVFGGKVMTLRETPGAIVTPLDGPEVQARICDAKVVFVYGWRFRAPGLVQKHAQKIRAYFQPVESYVRTSDDMVRLLRREADVVAGVHVRQGDYGGWRGGKYLFPISQYASWMRQFAEQFPSQKVSFLVCSDEPRATSEFPGLSVGLGTSSPMRDLQALGKCDFIFGPPSTFSRWASFYGNRPLYLIGGVNDQLELGKFRTSCLDA
jgi:hypothetical protein